MCKLINKPSLSLFHINACSVSKNIKHLEYLLDSTQIGFYVIAMIGIRNVKSKFPFNDINLLYFHLMMQTRAINIAQLSYMQEVYFHT